MTDMDNNPLVLKSLTGGGTAYVLPTEPRNTSLNANGLEYSGAFKLCIPVDAAENAGEVNTTSFPLPLLQAAQTVKE